MEYYKKTDDENLRKLDIMSRGKITDTYNMGIYQFDPNDFLDRSILFIGGSESGKTTLMLYLMDNLKNYYPRVIVFSTSNSENHFYDNKVPDIFIHDRPTKKVLENIWELASECTNTYNRVNQYKPMYALFKIVANRTEKLRFTALQAALKSAVKRIYETNNKPAVAGAVVMKLKSKFDKKIVKYMKSVVVRKRHLINKSYLRTEDELFAYHYLNYNPRTLLVFDDCTVELGKLISSKSKTIENLFYRGRHKYITHFYAMHTDKKFPTEIRSNAFVTILTDSSAATNYFKHENGLTKHEIAVANTVTEDIYEHEFEKLIYLRKKDFPEKFQSIKAELVGNFRMCSPVVWRYNNKVKKDSKIEKTKLTNKFERFYK